MSDRQFMPRDDGFHFDQMGDDWWATETAWFSFHHANRKLGGWFYTMARPNIGILSGGAWIWDDTASLPWEVPVLGQLHRAPNPEEPGPDRHQAADGGLDPGNRALHVLCARLRRRRAGIALGRPALRRGDAPRAPDRRGHDVRLGAPLRPVRARAWPYRPAWRADRDRLSGDARSDPGGAGPRTGRAAPPT